MSEQRWTDRLHLRRPTEDDLEPMTAIGVPESVVRQCLADWAGDGLGYWAVERGGELIGLAGLRFLTFQLRDTWDLHYWFAPNAWGYALEAVNEALAVAQEQSQKMPVVARTTPGDVHAFGLAERAGLTRRKDLDRDGLEVHASHW